MNVKFYRLLLYSFTQKEIIDVLELRETLEALGAGKAARHITKSQMKELRAFFRNIDVEGDPKASSAYARENQRFLADLNMMSIGPILIHVAGNKKKEDL